MEFPTFLQWTYQAIGPKWEWYMSWMTIAALQKIVSERKRKDLNWDWEEYSFVAHSGI